MNACGQTVDKPFPGGLESPQFRNLNLRGERWTRPPLVSLLANIGVLRAGRVQPLYLPSGRFALRLAAHWADASLRATGHMLQSDAKRAGSLRPWAQTFLKLLAAKAAYGDLLQQAKRPGEIRRDVLFLPYCPERLLH